MTLVLALPAVPKPGKMHTAAAWAFGAPTVSPIGKCPVSYVLSVSCMCFQKTTRASGLLAGSVAVLLSKFHVRMRVCLGTISLTFSRYYQKRAVLIYQPLSLFGARW
jgi:hypothetical protein